MEETEIRQRIKSLYPDAAIEITGKDCNFELYIVSQALSGKNTLQRQKSVLSLFKDDISSGVLHALTIKAKTPDELRDSAALVNPKLVAIKDE